MSGLFDKLFGTGSSDKKDDKKVPDIIAAPGSHICEDEWDGEDEVYRISFSVNDSFRPAKSHAAELAALSTYSPGNEYGSEEDDIYIAIMIDMGECDVIDEFKETGTVRGCSHFEKLPGRFAFRARINYYDSLMYFYALGMCDGYWDYSVLCVVYPAEYDGTESEKKLMEILDKAAESYKEEPLDE